MGVKMNLWIITKNNATDPEKMLPHKSIFKPFGHTDSVVVKNWSNRKPASSIKLY